MFILSCKDSRAERVFEACSRDVVALSTYPTRQSNEILDLFRRISPTCQADMHTALLNCTVITLKASVFYRKMPQAIHATFVKHIGRKISLFGLQLKDKLSIGLAPSTKEISLHLSPE